MSSISFIGLGNMGSPMARNLLATGHQVTVFDLNPQACAELAEAGARTATSALDACTDSDCVITMLPAGAHVETVYLGNDQQPGLLSQLAHQPLIIDCSTTSPETARQVAAEAERLGLRFIDAPVSGGVGGANAATLTFICGGEAAVFDAAKPVLSAMGKKLFHAGPHGAGQVAKICNNMMLAILMAGTSEALALGVKNGLDPAVLSEIIQQSSGGNWALNVYNPWPGVMEGVPASRDYQGGFLVDLMNKDLGLAMDNANRNQAATPLGSLARNLYQLHARQGNGKLDFSSIQQLYRDPE